MREFDAKKIISLFTGLILILSVAVSGGTYAWSRQLFVIAVLMLFVLSLFGRERPRLLSLWPVWTLLGATYLSALWTVNLNNTLTQAFALTGYALFACIVSFAAAGYASERLLKVVFFTVFAVAAYGIYQYFFGFAHTEQYLAEVGAASGLSAQDIGRAGTMLAYRRAFSTLFSPNTLACYLSMVFPIGLGLYRLTGGKAARAFYALVLAVILVALFLTKSVGGFASLVAGLLVYAALTGMKRRSSQSSWNKPLLLGAALIALALGYLLLRARTGGFFGVERSYAERFAYYLGALKIFMRAPVGGFGAGSFGILYTEYIRPGMTETRYAHDLFLQSMAETGLLGLAGLTTLFGAFFISGIRKLRAGNGGKALLPGIIAGGAAFFVNNLTDFSWYVPETAILFWFLFGLVMVVGGGISGGLRELLLRAAVLLAVLTFSFYCAKAIIAESKVADAVEALQAAGITGPDAARSVLPPEEAVRLAERAVSLKPYDDGFHAFLAGLYEGMAYREGIRYAKKAVSEYEEAVRFSPYYPFYYKDLGLIYLKLGDKARASENFRKALERYPASQTLKNYLKLTEK